MSKKLIKLVEASKKFLNWKYPNKSSMPPCATFETGYDAVSEKYFVRIDGNTISVQHEKPDAVVDLGLARLADHMRVLDQGIKVECVALNKENMYKAFRGSDLNKILNYIQE